MPDTMPLTVSLSPELVDLIAAKVASGEYLDEADVVEDALRIIAERDDPARWLADIVGPTYDRMRADPSRGIPMADIQAKFARRHAESSPR